MNLKLRKRNQPSLQGCFNGMPLIPVPIYGVKMPPPQKKMEMAIQHKRRTTRTELEFSDAGFIFHLKKVKVAHTRLPSVGFRS